MTDGNPVVVGYCAQGVQDAVGGRVIISNLRQIAGVSAAVVGGLLEAGGRGGRLEARSGGGPDMFSVKAHGCDPYTRVIVSVIEADETLLNPHLLGAGDSIGVVADDAVAVGIEQVAAPHHRYLAVVLIGGQAHALKHIGEDSCFIAQVQSVGFADCNPLPIGVQVGYLGSGITDSYGRGPGRGQIRGIGDLGAVDEIG